MIKVCTLIFLILLPLSKVFPQCCSLGSPIGGTSTTGVLAKKSLRIIASYNYGYSNKYLSGSAVSDFARLKSANYNYIGTILAYGITNRLTIESELGYFINKTQHFNMVPEYSLKGYGFNNAVVSAKYNLYKTMEKEWEISAGAGVKLPFTRKPQEADGFELPQEIQPSTGAFGVVSQFFFYKGFKDKGLRFFLLSRMENNFPNTSEFQYGNTYTNSFFITKTISHKWIGILQIRNENSGKSKRYDNYIEYSGSYLVFISPQINRTIKQKWNVSVSAHIPIYQYYNGTQLAKKFSCTLNLTRDFYL